MTDHLRLDFHLVEGLVVVDAHHAAHLLRQNDHDPQVCVHHRRLLLGRRPPSGPRAGTSAGMLLPPQASVQHLMLSCAVQLHKLLVEHIQRLIRVHAAAGELAEALLPLLHFCRLVGSSAALFTFILTNILPCSKKYLSGPYTWK